MALSPNGSMLGSEKTRDRKSSDHGNLTSNQLSRYVMRVQYNVAPAHKVNMGGRSTKLHEPTRTKFSAFRVTS